MSKFNAYLAGPIFTYGDFLRNTEWAAKLRETFPSMDLYSPVENTEINGVEGKKKFAGSQLIANGDNERLDKTDVLIACIDGDVIPAGTAAEIGKFHEKIARGDNKYIIGICTDNRQCHITHSEAKDQGGASEPGEQQYSYHNLYVTGLIKQAGVLVDNIDEAIKYLKAWYFGRTLRDLDKSFKEFNEYINNNLEAISYKRSYSPTKAGEALRKVVKSLSSFEAKNANLFDGDYNGGEEK